MRRRRAELQRFSMLGGVRQVERQLTGVWPNSQAGYKESPQQGRLARSCAERLKGVGRAITDQLGVNWLAA